MKLIIDIPDSDYTAVRCEALYYIGHDKLAESVTTAFQTATPYEERPQGKWVVKSEGTTNYYVCNKCDHAGDIWDKYCKHCGAEMHNEHNAT